MAATLPEGLVDYMRKAPIALAIGALDQPDEPLIEINEAFSRLTGYDRDGAVGRNCRFLQPEGAEVRAARARMRAFLDDPAAEAGRFEVPNIRADGSRFVNLVFMSRLVRRSGPGSLVFASQFDLGAVRDTAGLRDYDGQLGRSIDDVSEIGRNHGLMMRQSAELLSQSAATIAGIRFNG